MPKTWTNAEERRAYYKNWFKTVPGQACRRRTILEGAITHRRCPTRAVLDKYQIAGDDLKRILKAIEGESD